MSRHPIDLGDERLAALIAAATAPARPGELDGEESAVRLFRTYRMPTPPPRARRFLARVVVVKTVIALAMLGGVALAASSSSTPGNQGAADQTASTEAGERDQPVDPPSPQVTDDQGEPSKSPDAAPDPAASAEDLARLCRLYLDDRKQARKDPGYPALVEAADGRKNVDGYCRELLGEPADEPGNPGGDPGDDPGEGEPGGKPSVPGPASVHKGHKSSAERPSVPSGPSSRAL